MPDSVYKSLHRRFNRHEPYIMTGRKDGTNRGPLVRLDSGKIVSVDPEDLAMTGGKGKIITPWSWQVKLSEGKMVPRTRYAQMLVKNGGKSGFEYDNQGRFTGAFGMSVADMQKRPKTKFSKCFTCENAGKGPNLSQLVTPTFFLSFCFFVSIFLC